MKTKFAVFLVLLTSLLAACSSESKKDFAGGTEAESTIAIQVMLADGTPAAQSRVRVLPEGFLSDGIDTIGWNETDESGRIEIEKDDSGSYVVEVRHLLKGCALGAVAQYNFSLKDLNKLDTLELSELSTIEGFVATGLGPSVVRIPGIERFVVPDSLGKFVIDSLPPGNFDVLIESRSNRGSVTIQANAGETVPEVHLGNANGFMVENFESFSGQSGTGEILGDGWWYTLDSDGKNLLPLWNDSLAQAYASRLGCASGGCARVFGDDASGTLGLFLGRFKVDYALPGFDTLMFSARGNGKLQVTLVYGETASAERGFTYEVELSKVWQGYAIAVADMEKIGKVKMNGDTVLVSRIDFKIGTGDTLFLDDVALGGVNRETFEALKDSVGDASVYPKDWKDHDALLKEVEGYASGVRGGAGPVGESEIVGEVCIVTTTNDFLIVEDTTVVDDSTTSVVANAVVAPGSLRECATKDTSVWIVFEKSGTYNLQSPLRIKSNKTFDGRGRDIRITGMGILTDVSSNLIFENITFTAPAITAQDTTSRRALSIHNLSNYVWVDHCTFEEYPLVEIDVKRGSHNVTVSWCRFENAQTGILFGLTPDIFVDTAQTFTMHHNYFDKMENAGVYAHGGDIHAYNNFFNELGYCGVECSDSARCFLENNVFNNKQPVSLYRNWKDDVPDETTIGFAKMEKNWIVGGIVEESGDAQGFLPHYQVDLDVADAGLAWNVKGNSGPR